MAFPVAATKGTAYSSAGSSVTSHAVAYPASIAAGDLLLLICGVDGITGAVTAPGFTTLTQQVGGSERIGILYKWASGSESGTVTVTTATEQMTARMWRITGAHNSTPPEVATFVGASSANYDPPSLTASWGVEDTMWVAVASVNGGPGTVTAYPLPDNQENSSSGGSGAAGYAACSDELAQATLNPGTFTGTAQTYVAATIAIRPAGAASTAPTPTWAAASFGTDGGTKSVTMPASIAAGDLLLLIVAHDQAAAPTTPADWTLLEGGATSTTSGLWHYGKIAVGSDTASIVLGANDYVMICGKIPANDHSVTALATDIKFGTAIAATASSPDLPSVNGGSFKDWLAIATLVMDHGSSGQSITAVPAFYTDVLRQNSVDPTTSNSVGLGVATRRLTDIQVEDPANWTQSISRQYRSNVWLVPPEVGGGAPPTSLVPQSPRIRPVLLRR